MLIAFHKPYGVLSQFTSGGSPNRTLAEFAFPKSVYPIGRLDADSEGLLLLSDEPELNERLLHPRHAHEREYWVQIERIPTPEALGKLSCGVTIQDRESLPCRAWRLDPQPTVVGDNVSSLLSSEEKSETPHVVSYKTEDFTDAVADVSGTGVPPVRIETHGRDARATALPPRDPPIRFRKSVPDCWIGLELVEGKNRQVRRMTAAIGHPTLRLIRVRIGNYRLNTLAVGSWRILMPSERALVLS